MVGLLKSHLNSQCITEHCINTLGAEQVISWRRSVSSGSAASVISSKYWVSSTAWPLELRRCRGMLTSEQPGPATLATNIPTTEQFSLQAAPRQLGQRRGGRRGGGGRGCHRDPGGLRVLGAAGVWRLVAAPLLTQFPHRLGPLQQQKAGPRRRQQRRGPQLRTAAASADTAHGRTAAWQHTSHTFACVNISTLH